MALFERLRTEPVYNTRAVTRMTGVPADTFRAWERRYGVPQPGRTEGNHRLYSERDVATIRWLREQTHRGLTISQAVALLHTETATATRARPERLPADPAETNGAKTAAGALTAERLGGLRDEMVEALLGFDPARADRVVEEAVALLTVEDVCLHVLQEVLVEVGERWHRGEIGVGVEHFATAYVIRKLGALFNLSRPDVGRGPLVAACAEGELHEVGLLLTCLFLSRRGFRVVYLGPNLPLPDLIEAVEGVRPPLVLLSATTRRAAEHLAVAARELATRHPVGGGEPPLVGFGGRIFTVEPALRDTVAGVFLGRDADEAVTAVEGLLAAPVAAVRRSPAD